MRWPLLCAIAVAACGDTVDNQQQLLTIDPDLSVGGALGGNIGLAVGGFDDCSKLSGPATAEAEGIVLASIDTPQTLIFGTGKRFLITVPGSAINIDQYGVPAQVPVVVHAVCDGKKVKSNTFTVEYVPVLSTITTPSTVTHFWPADNAGEILACSGDSLIHYDATGGQIGNAINLGFSCTLGELRGDVGGRRFLTVDSDGMAAIDPGPTLVWTRVGTGAKPFLFQGMWTSATEDVAIVYRTNASDPAVLALVDRDTGLDKFPAITTQFKALPPVTRDASGNIGVLTWNKEGVENVYYTEYYDALGTKLREPIRVSSFPSGTPYAEFSFDGTVIYVPATDGEGGFWIQMSTLVEGTLTELSGHSDGWKNVVGGAFGRLLVASDDQFIWINPDTQSVDGVAFAPDSGIDFFRIRVEGDGSTIMLADNNSNSGADGFYVFAPDGSDVIRLHQGNHFSWLAESVNGGSLVGLQDGSGDIQEISAGHDFATQR